MANTPQSDFVQVQLTPFGQTFAKGNPLTVSNGRRTHTFTGATAVKVELSYEWKVWLSKRNVNGQLLFELVPETPVAGAATGAPVTAAASATAAPVAAATVKPVA